LHASELAESSLSKVDLEPVQSSGFQAYSSLSASGCSRQLFLRNATPEDESQFPSICVRACVCVNRFSRHWGEARYVRIQRRANPFPNKIVALTLLAILFRLETADPLSRFPPPDRQPSRPRARRRLSTCVSPDEPAIISPNSPPHRNHLVSGLISWVPDPTASLLSCKLKCALRQKAPPGCLWSG